MPADSLREEVDRKMRAALEEIEKENAEVWGERDAAIKRAEAAETISKPVTECCGQESEACNPENPLERRCNVNPEHEWTIPLAHEIMTAEKALAEQREKLGHVTNCGEHTYVGSAGDPCDECGRAPHPPLHNRRCAPQEKRP